MYTFAMWLTHRHNWAKKIFWGGPNSSRPSKLAIWKHNHAFLPFKVHYWFLNIIWDLLMANLGPSDDKFGTFWGVQGPSWSPSWLRIWTNHRICIQIFWVSLFYGPQCQYPAPATKDDSNTPLRTPCFVHSKSKDGKWNPENKFLKQLIFIKTHCTK